MTGLLHLGDLDVALPLGAALGAWLLAAGAWRTAWRWSLCFGSAVALVAGTKIAFLGWGTGMSALEFKAVSGHATVVTALYPVLAWVTLYRHGLDAARAGLAAGLALGAVVAVMLVIESEHTGAEAASGWLLGAAASLATLASPAGRPWTDDLYRARLLRGLCCTLPVFAVSAWLMESAHVGYWMVRLAMALSGNSRPHAWDACG